MPLCVFCLSDKHTMASVFSVRGQVAAKADQTELSGHLTRQAAAATAVVYRSRS